MAQRVKLPDGRRLSFPDGMSQQEMSSAIQRNFPELAPQPQESQGWGGVASDLVSGLNPMKIGSMAWDIAKELPGEAWGASKQFRDDDGSGRGVRNLIAGVPMLGQSISNIPSNIASYFDRKGLRPSNEKIGAIFDFIKRSKNKTNIPEVFGVKGEQAGDALIRSAPEIPLWGARAGASRLGKTGFQGGKFGALGAMHEENPLTLGLLGGGIESAIKGFNALRPSKMAARFGNATPEQLAANMRAVEGTQTPLGDVIGSPVLKGTFENVTAKAPFAGAEKTFGKIQESIKDKGIQSLNDLSEFSQSGVDTNFVVKDLLESTYKAAQDQKNKLYEPVNKLVEKENIKFDTPNFMRKVQEYGDAFYDSSLVKTDPTLQKIISGEKTPSLVELRVAADKLNRNANQSSKSPLPSDRNMAGVYGDLGSALREDLNSALNKQGSKKLLEANKKANDNYKENFAPLLEGDIYKLIHSDKNPESIVREIVKPSKQFDKFSQIEKVQKVLPEQHRSLMGYTLLKSALNEAGELDINALRKSIKSLGDRQFKTLFPDAKTQTALKDFVKLADLNSEALNIMFNPKTGQRGANELVKGILLAGAGAGAAVAPGTLLTKLGAAGVIVGASRIFNNLMTSEKFRNAVIKEIQRKKYPKNVKLKDIELSQEMRSVVESLMPMVLEGETNDQ